MTTFFLSILLASVIIIAANAIKNKFAKHIKSAIIKFLVVSILLIGQWITTSQEAHTNPI